MIFGALIGIGWVIFDRVELYRANRTIREQRNWIAALEGAIGDSPEFREITNDILSVRRENDQLRADALRWRQRAEIALSVHREIDITRDGATIAVVDLDTEKGPPS